MFNSWKILFLASVLVLASACAKSPEKAESAGSNENYKKWMLYKDEPLVIPLAAPESITLSVYKVGRQRIYLKNFADPSSPFVTEVLIFNKLALRFRSEDPKSKGIFELLTGDRWQKGVSGGSPKFYLVRPAVLFVKDKAEGLKITIETEDGGMAEIIVTP